MRSSNSNSTGVILPHEPRWYQRCAAHLVFTFEALLTASLRWQWRNEPDLFRCASVQPVIFCIWHNRLALSMAVYRKSPRRWQPERRMAALVSASKDGALLTAILEMFGVHPVRGSSSRRGSQALLELTSWAERGYDLAITPDGPRGPRCAVQEGVIALAQLTGLPIVPVTWNVSRSVSFKSWDRFQLPLPFSRCEVVYSDPMRIPRDASDEQREILRLQLEKKLRESSKE